MGCSAYGDNVDVVISEVWIARLKSCRLFRRFVMPNVPECMKTGCMSLLDYMSTCGRWTVCVVLVVGVGMMRWPGWS